MTTDEHYVTGMTLSQFYHGAHSLGLDVDKALQQAQLTPAHLGPTARVPESGYEKFLLMLMEAGRTPCFGIEIGDQLMLPLYGPLTTLLLNVPTLADSIENFSRFCSLATGNCGGMQCHRTTEGMLLTTSMIHTHPQVRQHVAECVAVMLIKLLRLASAKPDLSFHHLCFEHSLRNQDTQSRLNQLMGCPIQWESSSNSIFIDRQTHELRLLGQGSELLTTAQQQAQQIMAELQGSHPWLDTVKWQIKDLMLTGTPHRELVADRLGISTRTLNRRLEEFGLSWQTLLNDIRYQQATCYLETTDLPVAQIASRLGFRDTRAFQRRFKCWTGMTPSDFRSRHLN